MLKISDFSRLTFIPAKTLRYYDEIGLFSPQHVDRFTGYRYYDVAQVPRLHRILALKALGLSLEQIRRVLHDNLTAEQLRGMLRLKQAEVQQVVDEAQQRLAFVETVLQQIEREGKMSDYDVVLKQVAAFPAASIHRHGVTMAAIKTVLDETFAALAQHIHTHNVMSQKPEECGITIYHGDEYNPDMMHLQAVFGITGALLETDQITVAPLPAIEQAASVIHRGPFTGLSAAYDAIRDWISANGYEITGPNREVTLAYDQHGDPNQWVTELQFPVRKQA